MPQRRTSSWLPAFVAALAAAAGCAPAPGLPEAQPAFALAPSEAVRQYAERGDVQWSTGLVSSPAIQRARRDWQGRERARLDAERLLLNVTTNWSDDLSDNFGSTLATGKITSAPSNYYATGTCYWITDNGWLLKYQRTTGATAAYRVSTTETFPNTAVALSNDGTRAYLMSASGKLFVVKTADGTAATGSPVDLGGTNANVAFGTPVFVDPLASRADGTIETLYAARPNGNLCRLVSRRGASGSTIDLIQTYALPVAANDIVRASPVVLGGKAVVNTWRRSTVLPYDHAADQGATIFYNTGVATPSVNPTTGATITTTVLEAPLFAPPAVEVNNAFSPILSFVPCGNGVAMIDLVGGRAIRSVPLVIDSATTAASGNLATYTYTAATTTLAAKYPKTNGVANVNGAGTVTTAEVYGARAVSTTNANQVYGYTKFDVLDTDVTAGNVLKAVLNAKIDLRCNASSNPLGAFNPLAPRIFRVHNNLSSGTGAAWLSTNLGYATRPPHMDGTAFDQTAGTLTARSSWELSRTGTSVFINGLDYSWNARGKVAQPGQDYTFGFVHTQLYESPSLFAGLTGVPAPRFLGGSASANRPRLVLTVSNAGMASPSISAPVTIDSLDQQIYAVNANALFKLSYSGAATSWVAGSANFQEDDQTRFALTTLGADGTNAGPLHTASSRFVENPCAPLFDGTYLYVHDNHPGYTRSAVTRFTPGVAAATPAVSGTALVLPTNSGGVAPFMSYDYGTNRLFLATYNTATNVGKTWMVNRF